MEIQDLTKEFIYNCEYIQLSKKTIINYKTSLRKYLTYLSDNHIESHLALNKKVLQAFISSLDMKISSKNQHIRSLNTFITYVNEEYDMNIKKLKLLKDKQEILYTPTDTEVKNLLSFYNNNSFIQCRNKTIITLFVNLGIRSTELILLDINNIDLNNSIITVHRKGNVLQQLPLNNNCKLQLHKYISKYHKNLDTNILFPSSRSLERLFNNDLNYLLKKTNVNDKITCHSLRRYCCTSMLKQGIPIVYVSRFMNHKDINITNKYYANIKATDIVTTLY